MFYYYLDKSKAVLGFVLMLRKSETRIIDIDGTFGTGKAIEYIGASLPKGVVYNADTDSIRAATDIERQARAAKFLYAGLSIFGKVYTEDDFLPEDFVHVNGDNMVGTLNFLNAVAFTIAAGTSGRVWMPNGTFTEVLRAIDNNTVQLLNKNGRISGALHTTGGVTSDTNITTAANVSGAVDVYAANWSIRLTDIAARVVNLESWRTSANSWLTNLQTAVNNMNNTIANHEARIQALENRTSGMRVQLLWQGAISGTNVSISFSSLSSYKLILICGSFASNKNEGWSMVVPNAMFGRVLYAATTTPMDDEGVKFYVNNTTVGMTARWSANGQVSNNYITEVYGIS